MVLNVRIVLPRGTWWKRLRTTGLYVFQIYLNYTYYIPFSFHSWIFIIFLVWNLFFEMKHRCLLRWLLSEQEIERESRIFNGSWKNDLFVIEHNGLLTEAIAKRGNPLSDGEYVKESLDIFTYVLFPDIKWIVEKPSLSSQTVARIVDVLASNIENTVQPRFNEHERIVKIRSPFRSSY